MQGRADLEPADLDRKIGPAEMYTGKSCQGGAVLFFDDSASNCSGGTGEQSGPVSQKNRKDLCNWNCQRSKS